MSCEPSKFRFDPNDVFYLCPPMCNLLHYRHGAVLAGLAEVALSVLAVFAFMNLHLTRNLTDLWTLLFVIGVLIGACITTVVMVYGIHAERPGLLQPQLLFLNAQIVLLLLASVGSIASMSLGIEWTHKIFSPFISVPDMEEHFGPIWPFCVAIVAFTGAALGIWFQLTVQGCQDYLLDKQYFDARRSEQLPLQLQHKLRAEQEQQQAAAQPQAAQ